MIADTFSQKLLNINVVEMDEIHQDFGHTSATYTENCFAWRSNTLSCFVKSCLKSFFVLKSRLLIILMLREFLFSLLVLQTFCFGPNCANVSL